MLEYQIDLPSGVSLDPLDSDSMGNAILMKHLVGTLVRYRSAGQFEPYLADYFTSERGNKVWRFHIRSDIRCQNGELVTPEGYVDSLKKTLRAYAKLGPIPIISDLVGWTDFLAGQDLIGLKTTPEGFVEFHFLHLAGEGFLEYLSMPYFGYLAAGNFDGDKWRSPGEIISSGPYELHGPLSNHCEVVLMLRSDWPYATSKSPKKVRYKTKISADAWTQSQTIIQTNLRSEVSAPAGFRKILGPPEIVRTVILNPYSLSQYFANKATRRYFQNALFGLRSKMILKSSNATIANSFYPSDERCTSIQEPTPVSAAPVKTLSVYVGNSNDEESQYGRDLIIATLKSLGWPYEELTPQDFPGKAMTGAFRKQNFDISLTGVVAGSVLEPWTANMMFCTSLGATFPDPSHKIRDYLSTLINSEKNYSIQEAGKELSRMVTEDAAVLPILHARSTWYFSSDLDISEIPDDLIIPTFEEIGTAD